MQESHEHAMFLWDQAEDGIVVVTIDDPAQSANTMNADYGHSMQAAVDRLVAEKDAITGVVITSAKKTFFAGGDLKDMAAARMRARGILATSELASSALLPDWGPGTVVVATSASGGSAETLDALDRTPLFSWGKFRWFEGLIPVYSVYEKTGEKWLLDLARKFHEQGFDYMAFYGREDVTNPTPRRGLWRFDKHVVNTGMALKAYALSWRLTRRDIERAFPAKMLAILDRAADIAPDYQADLRSAIGRPTAPSGHETSSTTVRTSGRATDLVEPLSPRELEVLRLLASDLDGPDIARHLVVSVNTLRTHTKNIYAKLGVTSRRAALRRAHELGLPLSG